MSRGLAQVAMLVADYDEAIAFFCGKLGFDLMEDSDLGAGKRWVVLAGAGGARLLLAKAKGAAQEAAIGRQAGGRVGFFLETERFQEEYDRLLSQGITFLETPRLEAYGRVAVFEDLYGNLWDLVEPR